MDIVYITLLTVFASGVGTITGFGISTIIVPVLAFFFSLPQTLLTVGIIHLFGDVWKIVLFRHGIRWRLVISFGAIGIVTSFLGASLVFTFPKEILLNILGVFLVFYALFLFIKPSFRIPKNMLNVLSGGALSGFFLLVFLVWVVLLEVCFYQLLIFQRSYT